MKTLELNGQKIKDTFQHVICENYDEALKLATNEYGWNEEEVLDRNGSVSVKLEDGSIIDTELSCIVVDAGSEDYIYYL